jgi:hypothetical protein
MQHIGMDPILEYYRITTKHVQQLIQEILTRLDELRSLPFSLSFKNRA